MYILFSLINIQHEINKHEIFYVNFLHQNFYIKSLYYFSIAINTLPFS